MRWAPGRHHAVAREQRHTTKTGRIGAHLSQSTDACCAQCPNSKRGASHEWGPAVNRVARMKARSLGYPFLWEGCYKAVHGWAGHMARAPGSNPAATIYRWRPLNCRHTHLSVRRSWRGMAPSTCNSAQRSGGCGCRHLGHMLVGMCFGQAPLGRKGRRP